MVDDKDAVRNALVAAGVQPLPGRFLDFLDPWGNPRGKTLDMLQHPVHQSAETKDGEPSTGAKSSSISQKNCGKPDAATEIRPQTYSSCARKTCISRLGI